MKLAIVGQGYVGLSLAVAAGTANFEIIGYDTNKELASALNERQSHIEGISNESLKALPNYVASNQIEDISECELVVIAVPTPLDAQRKPDLCALESACENVSKVLRRKALIINESTSFPGTLRDFIQPIFAKNSILEHQFAVSPERVDPGNQIWNQSNTPRLVAGLNEESANAAADFYSKFCSYVIKVSTPEVAEAAKLFENTFRQVNIAMVNELAQISYGLGIDVREVLDAAATKPFGFMKFNPSLGVGGHCIPIDPTYLSFSAENAGQHAEFIDLANSINLEMPNYVAKRIEGDLHGLKGKKILVVGIAYKPNVSDHRESPSLILIEKLKSAGAKVQWHDEYVKQFNGQTSVPLVENEYDATIIAVAHSDLDSDRIAGTSTYVFDCTGTFGYISGVVKL